MTSHPLYALFDSSFMGLCVRQYWAEIAVWERFLNDHPEIKAIVELGTFKAGLSVFFLGNALTRGIRFWTFDRDRPEELDGPLSERLQLKNHFVHGDFFRSTRAHLVATLKSPKNHPLLLFVDGSNKPLEFATFVPMLQEGDLIGVHDYTTEFPPEALDPLAAFVDPLFEDVQKWIRPSITRFYRRTAVKQGQVQFPAMINDQPTQPIPEKPAVATEWMAKTPEERGFWIVGTGTGRCGTGYLSQVLSSVGVKCSHEGMFSPVEHHAPTDAEIHDRIQLRHDHAWWGWEAESSWMAAPFLGFPEMAGKQVVHLVRDPVAVINSQMRMRAFERPSPQLAFITQRLPGIADWQEPEHQAAYFYVKWNEMIEPFAAVRWRIEDDVRLLLEKLAIYPTGEIYDNTTYNSRLGFQHWDLKMDNLPDELRIPLQEKEEQYGYG